MCGQYSLLLGGSFSPQGKKKEKGAVPFRLLVIIHPCSPLASSLRYYFFSFLLSNASVGTEGKDVCMHFFFFFFFSIVVVFYSSLYVSTLLSQLISSGGIKLGKLRSCTLHHFLVFINKYMGWSPHLSPNLPRWLQFTLSFRACVFPLGGQVHYLGI